MWERIECRIASTREWVAERDRDPLDEDGIRCYGVGKDGFFYFDYNDPRWGPPPSWNDQKTEAARVLIQEVELDLRTRVEDLPPGHWGKDADPARPTAFWELWTPPDDGAIEELYLVQRNTEIYMLDHINNEGLFWGMRRVSDPDGSS
jgi:hypothetical protein